MKLKRSVGLVFLLLVLGATLPGFAYDFHSWRSDGMYVQNSSTGQQSSHQAFNLYEQFLDAGSSSFQLYWMNELQENGGRYGAGTDPQDQAFGLIGLPNTDLGSDIFDNRQQDREVDWPTWPVVAGKVLAALPPQPARPVFTPNVPQAWSPVVYDRASTNSAADHILFSVSLEPVQRGVASSPKEQILNVYYPQTAAGLPGNETGVQPVQDRGTVRPYWVRGTTRTTPGIRVRDLAPVRASLNAANPGVGVVTQPPIFARVQTVYRNSSNQIVTEILPVVYLVVGTGESGDFAHVICLALKKPAGMDSGVRDWAPAPDPTNPQKTFNIDDIANVGTNITDYFDPSDASGGAVMWSYRVRLRSDLMMGSNVPTPVAGVSFADVGTAANPAPRLFVSTADGQIICLNAQGGDQASFTADGDARISAPGANQADDPEPEWIYASPMNVTDPSTVTGLPGNPVFHYGMAPAVARVPLTNLFSGSGSTANTVARAISNYNVSEWMLFTADAYGIFRGFDAPGAPVTNNGQVQSRTPQVRWQDLPPDLNANGIPDVRQDVNNTPEQFLAAPLIYQGGTPLKNDGGAILSGTSDVGYDDEVVFTSGRGSVYVYDAIGDFNVGGANNGQPTGATRKRFQFPQDEAALEAPPTAATPETSMEPRAWPRDVPDATVNVGAVPSPVNNPNLVQLRKGPALNYNRIYSRSAPASSLGANANPNGLNPNVDVGDDNLYIPYLYEVANALPYGGAYNAPAGYRAFYEYVGSMKPYGFIQVSRPILKLRRVTVTTNLGQRDMPLNRLSIGTVKASGLPSTRVQTIVGSNVTGVNPNFDASVPAPEDTVYFTTTSWYDDNLNGYVQFAIGASVELEYEAPTSTSNSAPQVVTETLTYPSCYRLVQTDPANPQTTQVVRGRASLTDRNARLEQFRIRRNNGNGNGNGNVDQEHEAPALVNATLFTSHGYRQPSMYASGSSGTQGNVMAPAWFRGRIIALTHNLGNQRTILGSYDPRLDPQVQMLYGGGPEPNYGPKAEGGARDFTYDPGVFFTVTGAANSNGQGNMYGVGNGNGQGQGNGLGQTFFGEDEPLISDVGGSVTIVDGWTYVTHRNGHVRAYANQGGGGTGTVGGNPPIVDLNVIQPPNSGTLVKAPYRDTTNLDANRGIHISFDSRVAADPTNTMYYADRSPATPDAPLLLEWGQTFWVVVDFGPANEIGQPNELDANRPPTANGGNDDIDPQILDPNNTVAVQIRSPNGAVQQLTGQARGTAVQVVNNRVVAVVQVYAGVPSLTNPLTPGTPLLWEKGTTAPNDFTGEVTYELQVAQQGVRWRWPPYTAGMNGQGTVNAAREHYWEAERSTGQTRYPTTAGQTNGQPNWTWASEWAPLVSYNNPIMVGYDPDGNPANALGGIYDPNAAGTPRSLIAAVDRYTDRNAPGRKNGDEYSLPSVDGARSGSSRTNAGAQAVPIVPMVGMGVVYGGSGATAKQLLFGEHGKSTPSSTTLYPEVGKLRVADRSYLALAGRGLNLRVQAAPLTKMGMGALYGRLTSGDATLANLGAPAGSFEQNMTAFDDGPHGMYSSIPAPRLSVTKQGSSIDVTRTPITVAGRAPGPNGTGLLPVFNSAPGANAMEQLAVQVDIPAYTADDVYSTRWRSAGPNGADPRPIGANGSRFNPFFPGNGPDGQAGRPLFDRAERYSRPGGQGPTPAVGEDPTQAEAAALDPQNPNFDDRLRRVVIFNDANNNEVLDLTPNYREAYRTFVVQVAVKPEMKIEAQQQQIDFGNVWHGKKQPGTGPGALEIREWQRMAQLAASNAATDKAAAQFWGGYWRPFNLINTGNVNLAYVKPEVAYQIMGSGAQLIGIPSEGNDPWKALRLINGLAGTPNPLVDPLQIFLRTSFDDQLLPDANAPYGAQARGVWLQKAQPGAAQGGSVAFADPNATAAPNAALRDPTNGGQARPTFISLNVPTGTPLGNYAGSLRFYNDRSVTLVEDPNLPLGYAYVRPETLAPYNHNGTPFAQDGTLNRGAGANLGEPVEPTTDPPLRIKTKIIENLVHGRHQTVTATADEDRRFMPAAAPDIAAANGSVQRLILSYVSNRSGQGGAFGGQAQPNVYDLWGTMLTIDPNRGLFPYDELPRERAPWTDFTGGAFGWTQLAGVTQTGMQTLKPSMVKDPATNTMLTAWTERTSTGQGNDQYRMLYRFVPSGNTVQIQPNGQAPDPRVPRSRVRILPVASVANNWLALYSMGQGLNRSIGYTFTPDITTGTAWVQERSLATPKGLSSVTDPFGFVTPPLARQPAPIANQPIPAENTALPEMLWTSFTGSHLQFARTDVYLSRYRVPSLLQAGSRATTDLVDRQEDFARVGFPRTENDVLRANKERTRYVSSGADFLVRANSLVELYISHPRLPSSPHALLPANGVDTPNGEIQFAAQGPNLAGVTIYVDKAAGVFRLSHDARTLVSRMIGGGGLAPTDPDPLLTANFTAATVRITKGDVPASDSVVVPTLSDATAPVMDASWYRQQIDPGKWNAGMPVAGIADRLWVFWRRSAGANSGGATCFYKTLRPGIRVRVGAIRGVQQNELQVNINGSAVLPEEVNPQVGQIYFPQTHEGQRVTVSYIDPTGVGRVETHYVGWVDETGERPVPMDTSVNEGSLDGFVSYEDVGMSGFGAGTLSPVRHVEKLWLFWSSTRGTGGDLMYATIAPRIGPDANVGSTATLFANGLASFSGLSPNAARAAMAAAAETERRRPYTVPPIFRRGPYVPVSAAGRRVQR